MTSEQIILQEYFKTTQMLLTGVKIDNTRFEVRIAEKLRRYPFASEVLTELVNGEVFILDADDRIEYLVGYTPDELRGKPLSYIMHGQLKKNQLEKMILQLNQYGSTIKSNVNKCKDGSTVHTFGVIEDLGGGKYKEVVVDASKIIGYEMGAD